MKDKLTELFSIDFTEEEDKFPRPLVSICKKLGIDAYFSDEFTENESGKIVHESDNKISIYVNSKHSAARNIFTIAHELGHYVKHKELLKEKGAFLERQNKTSAEALDKEVEANQFAARLLMPEDKFIEIYDKYFGKLLEVANFFGVSIDAAYYRGLNLGLIKEV